MNHVKSYGSSVMIHIFGWSLFIFGAFTLYFSITNRKKQSKKSTLTLIILAIILLFLGSSLGFSEDKSDKSTKDSSKTTKIHAKKATSKSSSSIPIDDNLINTFKNDLIVGNTNDFINKYIVLDMKTQSAYYQEIRSVNPVLITGQVFKTNSNGSRLYLYVNDDDPAMVHLDRISSYDGVEEMGQLHNVFIIKGQQGAFTNVQNMSTVTVQGTLGATNIYEKGKMDMPFDLNDATLTN